MADQTPRKGEEKIEGKIPERKDIALPIDWHTPDSVPTNRATNMVVQVLEDEFILSFFEQRGPIIANDYNYEKATQLEALKALCVARICLTPERVGKLIDVLKRQHDKYMNPVEPKGKAAESSEK